MSTLMSFYAQPVDLLLHLPPWLGSIVVGVQLTLKVGIGGWLLARTGRSPLWVFLLLVPYVDLVALWLFAYAGWPAERLVREAAAKAAAVPPDRDSAG